MIKRLLLHPRADRWILLFGVLLTLPALGIGFFNDDLIHMAHIAGDWPGPQQSPLWSLFSFVVEDPAVRSVQDHVGILPWWSPEDLRLAFLRPLSSATHWLDYAVWKDNAVIQHAHSLGWWALCLVGARLVLRRIHGAGGLLSLALLLFAIDDAHLLPIGWIANRNALVALAMGLFSFYSWLRWRDEGGLAWAAATAALLGLSLLGGESGIGAFMWMIAWQLTAEDGPLLQRLRPLVAPALVVVLWRVGYQLTGYGAIGSGVYIDPGHDVPTFLVTLAERLPLLGLTLLTGAPVEVQMVSSPELRLGTAAVAVVICGLALVWTWPMLREDRLARFHTLGLLLALVPACATFPMSRLLTFASLNGAALLAGMARRAGWLDPEPSTSRNPLLGLMMTLNGPVAAAALVGTMVAAPLNLPRMNDTLFGHRKGRPGPEFLIQVNGEPMMTPYMKLGMVAPSEAPDRLAVLSAWTQPVTVTREDASTLVLTVEKGFLRAPKEQLFRTLDEPFHVGDQVVRPDYTALVRAVLPSGDAQTVAFRFKGGLDAPTYEIEAWLGDRFGPLPLAVGETRRLPSVLGQP